MPAASTADAILDAAVAALSAVTWNPAPSKAMTLKKRKLGKVTSGTETPAIIATFAAPEQVEDLYGNKVLVKYMGLLEFALADGEKLGDTATILGWREQARKKIGARATFSGIAGFNAVGVQPDTTFDPAGLSKGQSISLLRFVVEVIEDRE